MVNFKKLIPVMSPRKWQSFLDENFHSLKTTEVMKIRELISKGNAEIDRLADGFVRAFHTAKNPLSMAWTMTKRKLGGDLTIWEAMRTDLFWKFLSQINWYLGNVEANSKRAKKRYLTRHK